MITGTLFVVSSFLRRKSLPQLGDQPLHSGACAADGVEQGSAVVVIDKAEAAVDEPGDGAGVSARDPLAGTA